MSIRKSFHALSCIYVFTIFTITIHQASGQFYDTIDKLRTVVDALPHDPDLEITPLQSIRRHGYPAESHILLTDDGYILTVYRIPCGRNCTAQGGRGKGQPVLLSHGFSNSGAVWIVSGPDRGLAYLLADAGYDVWLMNSRGTSFSLGHVNLSTNPRSSYWDFGWHEMGIYDVATHIDWIYNLKNQEGYQSENPNNMILISHSMGATMYYVLFSMRPEYNERVAAMFNTCPIGYVRNVQGVLRLGAPFVSAETEGLLWLTSGNQLQMDNRMMKYANILACTPSMLIRNLCENLLFLVSGFNPSQFNDTLLPLVLNTIPAGVSSKSLLHYGQEVNAGGNFQQWDYGIKRNLKEYGQRFPPSYNISRITVPTASFYGEKDFLATFEDVVRFDARLVNSLGVYSYPFEHLDFIFGIDAYHSVYRDIINMMKGFQ